MRIATEPIDVTAVPPPQRHPLIFGSFDALATGASIELVNDHDPAPLRNQFEKIRTGQFDWTYLASGPKRWHVRIARIAAGPASAVSSACGGGSGGRCGCHGG